MYRNSSVLGLEDPLCRLTNFSKQKNLQTKRNTNNTVLLIQQGHVNNAEYF